MERIQESYERFKLAQEAAKSGIIDLNVCTGEMYISPEFKALLGYGDDEIPTAEALYELIDPQDLELAHFIDERVKDTDPPPTYQIQLRILAKSGKWRWTEMQCIQQLSENGHCHRIVRSAREITNQILLEVAGVAHVQTAKILQQTDCIDELYPLFFDLLSTTLDIDTLLLFEFENGNEHPDILYVNHVQGAPEPAPERLERLTPVLHAVLDEKRPLHLSESEQTELGLDGTPSGLCVAVPFQGRSGSSGLMIAEYFHSEFIFDPIYIDLFTSIADHVAVKYQNAKTLQQLSFQASHDALTGLINRQALLQELNRILTVNNADEDSSALLMIDLNRFKPVNDSYGHNVGDALLKHVARRMEELLDGMDHLICRWAGDEFVVMLRNICPNAAEMIAETICYNLQNPFTIDNRTIFISASIGIMPIREPFKDAFHLIRCADMAMYYAKTHRRPEGKVISYDEIPEEELSDRMWLETDLHKAIDNNEFFLKYQPLLNPQSGRIEGMEALTRWRHPVHGEIPPDRFIPVAEETGMITDLGLFILQQACLDAVELAKQFPHLKNRSFISVNVSPRQLYLPNFVDEVQQIFDITECPSQLINMELTESSLMENPDAAIQTMQRLKALGVSITIDDFGTGYSSLAYLVEMTVDGLKIDRQFVTDMDLDPKNIIILRTIIQLANDLELKVTAEGIETQEQFDRLDEMGCHLLQGYLISHPLELAEISELIGSRLKRVA